MSDVEMSEAEAVWLDGNAIAGLLHEVLGIEVTTVPRRCQHCGQVHQIGEHRLYRGAGMVLRCPNCDWVAARITPLRDHYMVETLGEWRMQFTRA